MRRLHLFGAFLLLLTPALAWAQLNPALIPDSLDSCDFVTGDIHFDCVPIYLGYLIQLVFGFIGTICLIEIIWGGYEYAFSGGGDTTNPKNRIKHALIGLTCAVLAYLIVDTIVSALLG